MKSLRFGRVGTVWTPAMIQRLGEFAASGRSASQAAKAISDEFNETITRSAAIGRAHRSGIVFNSGTNGQRMPNRRIAPRPRPAEKPVRMQPVGMIEMVPERPLLPHAVPPTMPEVRPDDAERTGVPLLEATGCRWMLPNNNCCNEPQDLGSSWCRHHRAVARGNNPPVRKKATKSRFSFG